MTDAAERELLQLSQKLLNCIAARDWKTYEELCAPDLTCFEPEARGQLVEGLAFHKFYFELGGGAATRNTTICAPRVRVMGDVALVSYTRLSQRATADTPPTTSVFEETRVWQRSDGRWRHMHFHRSVPA